MNLDLFTLTLTTALVVYVGGLVFLVETMLRRDHRAGRVWSLAFLSGMLTTLCYLIWTVSPQPWIAIAIGNGALVAAAGFLWLGSLGYNGRSLRLPGIAVAAGSLLTVTAVLVEGPDGGDWAGALVMFVGVAGFAGLGAVESRKGAMGASLTTLSLTIVLGVESLFYAGRAVVTLAEGPEGEIFTTWFGSASVGFLTITMTIVALVTLSTLRVGQIERDANAGGLSMATDGLLGMSSFERVLTDILAAAGRRAELIAVVALEIEEMSRIKSAFGRAEQEDLVAEWRAGIRRHTPTFSVVGDAGPTTVLLCFQVSSVGEARRIASLIHREMLDDFAEMRSVVIPMMGVGLALTTTHGYEGSTLIDAAQSAAMTSGSSSDASVMIADAK